MNLEERIARLIDPRPWNPETAWWIFATHQQTHEELVAEAQEQTRVAARRVIDGLGLREEDRRRPTCAPESWYLSQQACLGFLMTGNCPHIRHEHRLVTPWEPEEDA